MVEAAAGDVAAARALFRSAVRAEPDMAATYTAWARMEATARRGPAGEEAARRVFEEGQRADPSHVPLLHVSQAGGFSERHSSCEPSLSASCYFFSLQLPACLLSCGRTSLRVQAWAMFELNHDKQSAARRLLARALELDPHHVPSWMVSGMCLRRMAVHAPSDVL